MKHQEKVVVLESLRAVFFNIFLVFPGMMRESWLFDRYRMLLPRSILYKVIKGFLYFTNGLVFAILPGVMRHGSMHRWKMTL